MSPHALLSFLATSAIDASTKHSITTGQHGKADLRIGRIAMIHLRLLILLAPWHRAKPLLAPGVSRTRIRCFYPASDRVRASQRPSSQRAKAPPTLQWPFLCCLARPPLPSSFQSTRVQLRAHPIYSTPPPSPSPSPSLSPPPHSPAPLLLLLVRRALSPSSYCLY